MKAPADLRSFEKENTWEQQGQFTKLIQSQAW
jgi:hypothetical protein